MSKKSDLQFRATELDLEFTDKSTVAELTALIADSEGESEGPKSIVPEGFKAKYKSHGGSCGDDMAEVFGETVKDEKGKIDVTKLEEVMAQNGIDTDRWSNLNVGQRRMNLGNVLRAKVKRGEFVEIGSTDWNPQAKDAEAA